MNAVDPRAIDTQRNSRSVHAGPSCETMQALGIFNSQLGTLSKEVGGNTKESHEGDDPIRGRPGAQPGEPPCNVICSPWPWLLHQAFSAHAQSTLSHHLWIALAPLTKTRDLQTGRLSPQEENKRLVSL